MTDATGHDTTSKKRKAERPGFILHWTRADPYKCYVVYVAGPDVSGAMEALDREFVNTPEADAAGCPKMSEYLMPELEDPTPPQRDAGRFFWHTKEHNVVIYFPTTDPELPTLGHELYHAVRCISRKKRLENEHDEPEAYLFEQLFGYFAGKLEEDRKKGGDND